MIIALMSVEKGFKTWRIFDCLFSFHVADGSQGIYMQGVF